MSASDSMRGLEFTYIDIEIGADLISQSTRFSARSLRPKHTLRSDKARL